MKVKNFNYLMDIRVIPRSSGTHQGAQAFKYLTVVLLGLLTSQKKGTWRGRFTLPKFALFACAILLSGFLFSHSAYATTPYLNVSSGAPDGLISFSKVQPSSAGTMATASDTLTVNTNCMAGYNVYVSAINGGETSLVNDAAASSGNNVIMAASATVGGTSAVLSANTWGVNGNSADVADGKYFGLPTYANATDNPLVTMSNLESEETTIPIYYGAKVTTAIAPGSYNGDVLYTVLVNASCLDYYIAFNANGGSGEMNNQTVTVGETTNLSTNTYTRSGYVFLGWSESQNGKTGTAVNGVGTMEDVDYKDEAEITDLTTGGQTKTLYAIWALVNGDMQSFTCSSLASGATAYYRDSRDGQVYSVYRVPTDQTYASTSTVANIAGKCIMTKDLNLGAVDSISGSSSTIVANGTMTLSPNDSYFTIPDDSNCGSNCESITIPTSNVTVINNTGSWNATNSSYANKQYTTGGEGDYASRGYYSWGAAMVACPKGWRLLTIDEYGSSGGSSFESQTTGLAAIVKGADYSTTINNITGNPYFFVLSGRYGGSFYNAATEGYYWPSTQSSSISSYYQYIQSSKGLRLEITNKYLGHSVRCIAQNSYTINYDANGGSGTPSKTTEGTQAEGNYITTATVGSMTKTGYHFAGWSRNSGNNNTVHHNANTSTLVKDIATAASASDGGTITLYAVWQKNTFTINYDGNSPTSGTPSKTSQTATYGTNVTMPTQNTLAKTDYEFLGWSLSSTATSATWTAGQSGIAPTAIKSNVTTTNGGSVTVYAVWAPAYTYVLSYSGVDFATSNKPSTQTWTGSATSHTFTIPSSKPAYSVSTGVTLTFSNYTYNGTTYSPGSTITLSSSSPSVTLTANWTRSCTISSSTGCKLANGKTWIYGKSGKYTTWANIFTNATNVDGHNATIKSGICPSGYSAPTITVFDSLVRAYGGTSYTSARTGYREFTGVLYRILGLSSNRIFWSSTEYVDSYQNEEAYVFYSTSEYSDSDGYGLRDHSGYSENRTYILCYK